MQIYPGRILNDFIEPNKCQYAIPVYQRNYAWPEEQCRKLFDDIIQAYKRDAKKLAKAVIEMHSIDKPQTQITFEDPRYQKYTAEDPSQATYKSVSYYELIGERVNVDNFTDMLKSISSRLYELDSAVLENIARNEIMFDGWYVPIFSYDPSKFPKADKVPNTDIYVKTGIQASSIMHIIRSLIQTYGLDVKEDFVYCARSTEKKETA